jgi:hypothetical protein
MRVGHLIGLAVLTPLLLGGLPVSDPAQASNTLSGYAAVNCGNFLPNSDGGQQHAQVVYDADPSDPYGLDGPPVPNNDTRGEPGIACETEGDLGTAPPASCPDFLPAAEGGREQLACAVVMWLVEGGVPWDEYREPHVKMNTPHEAAVCITKLGP